MAWCPKCRNEYVDGITVCSECKCELVDELEEIKELKYLYLKECPNPDELVDYLHQTGIESAEFCELEEDGVTIKAIGVSPKEYMDASINLLVYFEQEREDYDSEYSYEVIPEAEDSSFDNSSPSNITDYDDDFPSDDSDESGSIADAESFDDIESSDESPSISVEIQKNDEHNHISTYGNSVYVTYADRYEEEKSSAYTLLFVGTIGGLALILELLKVYQFPIAAETKWLFYLVFGLMMAGFIIYGYISYNKSIDLQKKAEVENKIIDDINEWTKENLNAEDIDSKIETDIQEELLYFNRIEFIKESIMHQFEEADEPLIDTLIENIYSNIYENE